MPYRSTKKSEERRPEAGSLIEEIAGQFTDPYAFLRELVQNAIDAGASRVKVGIDEQDGEILTSVADDGSGMTLAMIEGPLLTVFSSSKEGQKGKIGRYGVGFMSVFALDPVRVVVDTWRKEGAYRVVIGRDHAFEVTRASAREGHGSAVTLVTMLAGSGRRTPHPPREEHGALATRALRRWCRHVAIPVELSVFGTSHGVSEPFALRAAVTAEGTSGEVRAIVGVTYGSDLLPGEDDGGADFAAYFNRGLTLLETSQTPPAIGGLRFKVESPSFSHTISRDDVKRDDTFDDAMALVRKLADDDLPRVVANAEAPAAEAAANDPRHVATYLPLLAACSVVAPERTMIALAEPHEGRSVMTLRAARKAAARGRIYAAQESSAATATLAELGYVLVRTEAGRDPASSAVSVVLRVPLRNFWQAFTFVEPHEPDDQLELRAAIQDALRDAGRPVTGVQLVRPSYEAPDDAERATWFVDTGAPPPWLAFADRPARGLLLVASASAAWRRAVQATDQRAAAGLVARLALLEAEGTPDAATNDALLGWAARESGTIAIGGARE